MRKKNTDSVVTVPKLYTIKDVHDLFASWNEKYGSSMYVRHHIEITIYNLNLLKIQSKESADEAFFMR